jgi:exodeoxyribonuclease-1
VGYVFFDTETTGLSPAFDQIVHFAAVHTDYELREIERFEVRSRLQPHVVPHPSAMLTNRLTIERLVDRSLPTHGAMVAELRHRLLAWSPAIFTGFNSIRFDEEMLRNALFQTLFHPYLTSGSGCGRADAYGLVQAACVLSPECLAVPLKSDGRRDFRLASLLRANGLGAGGAHDAMSDVLGTVALCRLVKDGSSDSWQRFVRLSNKVAVAELVDEEEGFVVTEFYGGEPYHRPVVCIGATPDDRHGRFCIDLTHDPDGWAIMSDEEVRAEIAKKGTPVRRLRVNAAPTLTPLEEAGELIPSFDLEKARLRARQYRAAEEIGARLIRIYTSGWEAAEASPFPEGCLYSGGFINDRDRWLCDDFHAAPWPARMAIVERLADPRLRSLARRLIYSEHRSMLCTEDQIIADRALADRLLEATGGPMTLPAAVEATEKLLVGADADSSALLMGYREYLLTRIARVRAFRATSQSSVR